MLAVVAAAVVVGVIWQLTGGPPPPSAAPAASAAASSAAATSAPASTAPPAPSPAASGIQACVDATVSALSLDEQVGQLLMVGTPVANPRTLTDAVSDVPPRRDLSWRPEHAYGRFDPPGRRGAAASLR
jgi:hypothetical protein